MKPKGMFSDQALRDEELSFFPLLPSAITAPSEGGKELAALIGATILRIGTTSPGVFEGGGLIIDYVPRGITECYRLVLAFSERGMWVEHQQLLPPELPNSPMQEPALK